MNGRERIIEVLKGGIPDRVPVSFLCRKGFQIIFILEAGEKFGKL